MVSKYLPLARAIMSIDEMRPMRLRDENMSNETKEVVPNENIVRDSCRAMAALQALINKILG